LISLIWVVFCFRLAACDRRVGLGRDLDEIQLRALGEIERFESRQHSNLSTIRPDHSHLG
jgi:hypothetical protein